MLMRFLYLLPLFHLILLSHSSPSMQPLCHDDESSALLQFKESFIINKSASSDDHFAYPKVESWTLEGESSDCCSWDGVSCDEDTGHVIGLDLSSSCLYGSINSNSSLFRLVHLQSLNLAHNHFNYSQIPSQVGNLSRLTYLNLSSSRFYGQIPFEVSMLSQLSSLDMGWNFGLTTQIFFLQSSQKVLLQLTELSLTSLVVNLTRLEHLDLTWVNISSTVPNIFANLSTLRSLYLEDCGMHGEFPIDIFMLPNLRVLNMNYNEDLTGSWPDFHYWSSSLEDISLQATSFLGNIPPSIGNLIQLFFVLLDSNHLTGPISFGLANLTQLVFLDLSLNRLTGSIPSLIGNLTKLCWLGLSDNEFQGQFPISISNLNNLNILDISNNNLSGTFLICNMTSLQILEVSDNYFSGSLPQCLHNMLELRMISLEGNQFQGLLPRSFANCTRLEAIDVSNNQFNDTFPSGLGNLPNLKILLLRSNKFYGQILESSETNYTFPNLQVVDLSYNSFTGNFPLNSFRINASKLDKEHRLRYMEIDETWIVWSNYISFPVSHHFQITNKGLDMVYSKVQESFRAIDISSNMFVGEIPESVGDLLKGLHMLNLSNNILTGHIPPSLGNLMTLEALDLSQNRLSGEIPPQLVQLTFLEWFNVSHNNLTGSIPQGKQFDTFENSSFVGNLGLCGNPLSKKCWVSDSSPTSPLISNQSQDSTGSLFEFGWKIVLVGYGFGLLVGVIIGNIVATRKHDWLMKTFGMKQRARRNVRREQRN
uniref:Leucine-rich repeat-containing N-terminal plant-type domain-containing protein n=1 Tax=Fagus sylvatica TaxID=28930 RepID=A0A2N9EIC9_FAGSY